MKRNKLFTLLLFLLPAVLLSSCLKDQEDLFDESSSQRLTQFQQKARATLMDAPYGWLFEIFPSSSQEYGGYAFTCKFDSLQVEVGCELDTSRTVKSYYKMSPENGATLTFDTYNELMHYFAEGTSDLYQGYNGDIMFVIDSISPDLVKVHGSRTNNTLYLRKLERPAKQYLADQAAFEKKYIDASFTIFSGQVNGKEIEAEVNPNALYADVTVGEETSQPAFVYTDDGIRFYSPLNVGDATLSKLTYNFDAQTYTGVDSKGNEFTLKASFPEWVKRYNAWSGDWTLGYDKGNSTIDVQLVPTSDKSAYLMRGLAEAYDVKFDYDKENNTLSLHTQYVGEPLPNKNLARLIMWDCDEGYITWNAKNGMITEWDEDNQRYNLVDNRMWGSHTVYGIRLYEYGTSGNRIGSLSRDYTQYMINGNNRMRFITYLKKK